MNRWTPLLVAVFLTALVVMGCSAGTSSPMTPGTSTPNLTQSATPQATQTHLWGYYDLYFDFENQAVEAVFNRGTQFTANVTTFVNNPPTNLAFNIHGTPVGADYIDVDIDVSITHPFAGLNQYDGYDVRGVFVGNGSETLEYGEGLRYPALGATDQVMHDYDLTEPDPYEGEVGNPDGYTRWFNPAEFPAAGVLGYTPGRFASPGYTGTATLNPYKYFADGLGADDDLVEFLSDPGYADNGIFTAGTTNTRNYYLRFPSPTPGVKYGYAIIATWEDPNDPNFPPPNNCAEAVALDYDLEPDLYYVDGSSNGGDFIADFDVYGWSVQPSTLTVETTVHSTPMTYDCATISAGGTELYSTYEVEFTVDNLTTNTSAGGMDEFWVILEYSGLDYGSVFSPTGTYPEQPLAAFFRYDLFVSDTPYNADPVVDTGVSGNDLPFILNTETYTVTAHDDDLDPLTYAWTVTDVATSTAVITDDPGNGDGTFDCDFAALSAALDQEFDIDCVVSDGNGGEASAPTLTVTCSNILWQDDMESGVGEWTTTYSGPNNGWAIVSGGNGNWWHSNSGNTTQNPEECAKLISPEIDIPAGVTAVHMEFLQEARGYFTSNTVFLGTALLNTYDGGAHLGNPAYPVESGPNYDNWDYPYTSVYHFGLAWICSPFDCWGVPSWTGVTTPTTTMVDVSSEIGNTVQFVFTYGHGLWYSGQYYWGVDDIVITVDP